MKNHIAQFCLSILCAWTMFSTIGCTAPIYDPRVVQVASSNGIAYAHLLPSNFPTDPYAQSEDGGKTWSPTTNVPQGIFQEKTQPVVLCDPNRASLCFRITQKSQVDESNDGGKTWHVGWQIPPGREDYMLGMTCKIFGCSRTGAWGPYDLSFLDQKGANTLLVAMGQEGVLVRTADGNWQRYGVLRATPSPLQASDLLHAIFAVFWEALILFALTVIFVPIPSIVAWLVLLVRMGGTPASGRRLWAMRPILFALAIAVLAFCILVAAVLFGAHEALDFALNLIRCGVAPALVIGFVWTWKRLATLTTQPMKGRLTGCGAFAALLIFPMGWLPLLLWAFGIIARYDVALWMALILGLGALAFAIYISVSSAITATTANTQTGER